MKSCPRCDAMLTGPSCACGWHERTPAAGHALPERRCPCHYAGCPHDADIKIMGADRAWLNVCAQHLRIYHHLKAEHHCNVLGLDTPDKRRAFLRQQISRLARKLAA